MRERSERQCFQSCKNIFLLKKFAAKTANFWRLKRGASEASANIFKVVRTFSELKKLAAKTVNFLKIKKFACEAGANVFKVVERFFRV